MPSSDRIYLSPPSLSGHELELLDETLRSNWIAPLGPQVDAFESEFAETVRIGHATALSSGTAALHLALRLLGVGAGDVVLCPTLTFVATANAISYLGASPVFIDSDAATWNLDPVLLEEELAQRSRRGELPRAVITVDLYGQSADHEPILELCERYDVPVVEDAAEALGSTYKQRPVGAFGRFGVFSFNGNKIITTSGGGMLVSDNGEAIAEARSLAAQARDEAPHYEHSRLGYNYRLSNLLAAVGRAQLVTLEERVEARRKIFSRYKRLLSDLPGLEFMPEAAYGRSNRWLTCLTIDPARFGSDRETVRLALEELDIESRPLWKPMHRQPLYRESPRRGGAVAEGLFDHGLCLPSGSALSETDQDRVAEALRGCCRA